MVRARLPLSGSVSALTTSANQSAWSPVDEPDNFQYLRRAGEWGGMVRRRESIRHLRQRQSCDLDRMIEVEMRVREVSSRLLSSSSHPEQCLQASKTLLTSDRRMNCYLEQLQQGAAATHDAARCGRVCLSDMRLPLVWRDIGGAQLRGRGDGRRYAVFCVVRLGTDVYDTGLVVPVDRSVADVSFDDIIVFQQAAPEFRCSVEVYSCELHDSASLSSTSRRIRHSISSSLTRTLGRKLAASVNQHLNGQRDGLRFRCIARTELVAEDVHESVRSHNLQQLMATSGDGDGQLPLFGQLCCRLAAQPIAFSMTALTGSLLVQRDAGAAMSMYAELRAFQLQLWPTKSNGHQYTGNTLPSAIAFPVDKRCVVVDMADCGIRLEAEVCGCAALELAFSTETQRADWSRALRSSVSNSRQWCRAGEREMAILTASVQLSSDRQHLQSRRALYDRVSLQEDAVSSPVLPPFPPSRPRRPPSARSRLSAAFMRFGSVRALRRSKS